MVMRQAKRNEYTVRVVRYEHADPRLGRHVRHDSRSLRYRFVSATPAARLASVRHQVNVPILDQGNIGSCTGHAGTAVCGGEAYWPLLHDQLTGDALADHRWALALYGDATRLDPYQGSWEPDDTGSDGLSIAKVLQSRGLVSGYQHATTLDDALGALALRPVMVGTSWLNGMFDPAADGRLHVTGAVAGGHEYCLDELDAERERVWVRNSWGPTWGLEGRAWMTWADLGRLLADSGDVTVLVPSTEPAPAPTPAPPPNPPGPNPLEVDLAHALDRALDNAGIPHYLQKAGSAWRKTIKE
jgi:hypothetical protein